MNKFSFLLAALCVSLNAQEAKPADAKPASAPAAAPELKLTSDAKAEPKAYFADVWMGRSISDCLTFQNNIQVLGKQVEELKRLLRARFWLRSIHGVAQLRMFEADLLCTSTKDRNPFT